MREFHPLNAEDERELLTACLQDLGKRPAVERRQALEGLRALAAGDRGHPGHCWAVRIVDFLDAADMWDVIDEQFAVFDLLERLATMPEETFDRVTTAAIVRGVETIPILDAADAVRLRLRRPE